MNGTFRQRRYQSFRPAPQLREIIEAIWVQESPAIPDCMPTTIVPTGRVELIFHYGEPFIQHVGDDTETMAMCHVVGQQQQPIVLNSTGNTGIAIVRFTPWGAYSLFGDALADLTGRLVDLKLIWSPGKLANLQQQLLESRNHRERARRAENFVAQRLLDTKLDRLSTASVHAINRSWGQRRVTEIASEFELGRRQFTRRFTRRIGASPKQVSCVLRAQKAMACVRAGIEAQDIVGRCGYADQPHFVRDITAYTGLSPSGLAALQASSAHRYFNSSDIDQFCGMTYL